MLVSVTGSCCLLCCRLGEQSKYSHTRVRKRSERLGTAAAAVAACCSPGLQQTLVQIAEAIVITTNVVSRGMQLVAEARQGALRRGPAAEVAAAGCWQHSNYPSATRRATLRCPSQPLYMTFIRSFHDGKRPQEEIKSEPARRTAGPCRNNAFNGASPAEFSTQYRTRNDPIGSGRSR